MLSEILIVSLITSNIVLSQTPNYEDWETLLYDDYKTVEPPSTEWIEEWPPMPVMPSGGYPSRPPPNPIDENPPAQEQHSKSGGVGSFFWFILFIVIVGAICVLIFWAYIGYDLTKDKQKRTENREQIIADKLQELDRVGMDQGKAESAANKTVSSAANKTVSSAPNKPVSSASSNTSKKHNSLESIRSSIGGQSSTTGASTSKTTANSVKSDPKGSKSKSISKTGPTK